MKNLIVLVITFSLWIPSMRAQTLSEDYNKDLTVLKRALYQAHPGVFRYISKDSLDKVFEESKFRADDHPTPKKLEARIRTILSKVGCIHTYLVDGEWKDVDAKMPFSFYSTDKGVWIRNAQIDSLKKYKGCRLISINGHSASNIRDTMMDYRASDGYNETFKYAYINLPGKFSTLYHFYYDVDSMKSYIIRDTSGDTVRIKVGEINKKKTKATPQKDISVIYDTLHQLAILKIRNFDGAAVFGAFINRYKYEKALKEIQQSGYKNMAIDLRNNLGGSAKSGNYLASFFVREKHNIIVRRHSGAILRYSTVWSKIVSILDFFVGDLFGSRRPAWPPGQSYSIVPKNDKFHFDGQLFVMTNGLTASTASNAASLFKHLTSAVIVGEETGGGEKYVNAYHFPSVKLPHSKLYVQIPQYAIDMGFASGSGHGVWPDIPAPSSIEDVLSQRDVALEAIYRELER